MILNETYLLFTADHDKVEAVERYKQRLGGVPKEVEVEGKNLVVGPVEVKDE